MCFDSKKVAMIFCSNPKAQYLAHKAEIDKAISRVLSEGQYILGQEVKLFENEFARYIGGRFAIGVGSGTEALHIALKACGIGKGDEVITVSHTAVATVVAIELCGASPVLVDIEPDFFTLNPAKLKKAISKKTKAIIPVHLYGQPADMSPILKIAQRYGIKVIEDCAQAHGAIYKGKRVGSLGDIACFSFYPTKNLGAIGDGGMIVSNNHKLANQSRLFREYGWQERCVSLIPGLNSRLDELQAAILRVKLKHLDRDNKARIKLASSYDKDLGETDLVLPAKRKNTTHVYHLYVVRAKERNKLKTFLYKKGIQTLVHYPVPIHLQPAYQGIKIKGGLSETERLADRALSLPMYPGLSESELQTVISAIQSFYILLK